MIKGTYLPLDKVAHNLFNPYTSLILNSFYLPFKSLILGMKWLFKHHDLQAFGLILDKNDNFVLTSSCDTR